MVPRTFFRLLLPFALVIAAATAMLDLSVRRAWEQSLRAEFEETARYRTQLFAANISKSFNTEPLVAQVAGESRSSGARVTIVDSSGKILADSAAHGVDDEGMPTPEIQDALSGKTASFIRFDPSLNAEMLYVATPLDGGAVRAGYPMLLVRERSESVRWALLRGSALALLVAVIVAALFSHLIHRRLQRIVEFAERIETGDLSARIHESPSDELSQVGMALDRTARELESSFRQVEASRQELETLLNSMQDAVIAVSDDARVQWVNGPLLALTAKEAVAGAPVVEVIRDPDFLLVVRTCLEQRQVAAINAKTIVPGRTYSAVAAPLAAGGAVVVLHDQTEIERTEKTRRDFIANVSHELRTPLTNVQGYAETLLDSDLEEWAREFVTIISKNAQRMSRLCEDLLTLARVESGEQRFKVRPVTPAELVNDAVQSFRERARAAGLEITLGEMPQVQVQADSDAVHQVFSNLIENAINYGRTGRSIELGAEQRDGAVEFYVRDFGQGIASEHLPRLFERFYRVDKARSRESGGTGLGLAIVKHIVIAHGGAIRAESELGHGSTFYFSLPAAAPVEAPVHW